MVTAGTNPPCGALMGVLEFPGTMAANIEPTRADRLIARAIARNVNAPTERLAQKLTWAADEHVLCALALGWWACCRVGSANDRRVSDHILLVTIAASVLPHVMKLVFTQTRPDRLTLQGHWHGVPLSGKADHSFPSGHAIHVGALASAATQLPAGPRRAIWVAGAGLLLTRIVLLAHWASDVIAGVLFGAGLERVLRPITGFGRSSHNGENTDWRSAERTKTVSSC